MDRIDELPNKGVNNPATGEQQRLLRCTTALKMRQKGYPIHEISAELGVSDSTVWVLLKNALQEVAKQRLELGELVLDETLESYRNIEHIIVRRGAINLQAAIRTISFKLVKARETGGSVDGRTAEEWESELKRLEALDADTGGLSNDDLDRLVTIRDKISKLLGVEPPKKMAVEHTFSMQAQDAQQRLRDKLGLQTVKEVGPGTVDGEVVTDNPNASVESQSA